MATLAAFRRLFVWVRPYFALHGAAMVLSLFAGLLALALPWLLGELIRAIWEQGIGLPRGLIAILAGLTLARAAVRYAQLRIAAAASVRLLRDLQDALHRRVQKLTLSYFEGHHSGDLVSRSQGDLWYVDRVVGEGLRGAAIAALTGLGALALMVWLSPGLTGLALGLMAPTVLLVRRAGRKLRRHGKARVEAARRQSMLMSETVTHAAFVRLWNLQPREEARFREQSASGARAYEAMARIQAGLAAVQEGGTYVGLLVLLAAAAWFWPPARGGAAFPDSQAGPSLGLGGLVAFLLYARMVYAGASSLAGLYSAWQQAAPAVERFFEVLDAPVEAAELAPAPAKLAGAIRFEGVGLDYPGRPGALEAIDLDIPAGSVLRIRGETGSGKTTLLRLLAALYRPTRGRVLVDGLDVAAMQPDGLRRRIGFLTQDTVILDGSLGENIALGRPGASAEALRQAARDAKLDKLLAASGGLDQRVGEAGWTLSRGERQRVAVARLLLRDPDIVVSDEGTASLDPNTRDAILELLYRRFSGRTLILVEHQEVPLPPGARVVELREGRLERAMSGEARA